MFMLEQSKRVCTEVTQTKVRLSIQEHCEHRLSHCVAVVVLNQAFRRCVFLPGELRPATCIGHL